MRPGRYEVALWTLSVVLLVGPYLGTTILANVAVSSGTPISNCVDSSGQTVFCLMDDPLYVALIQITPIFAGVGAEMMGLALAIRAVITARFSSARRSNKLMSSGEIYDDYDQFRRPE